VPNSTAARMTAAIASRGAVGADGDIDQSVAVAAATLRKVAARPSVVWAWMT
jgi:hypothetical protein